MKRINCLVFLLIFSMWANAARAQESSGEGPGAEKNAGANKESQHITSQMEASQLGLAADVMEKSGVNAHLENIPHLMKEGLERRQKQREIIPRNAFGEAVKIIEEAFYPGRLQMYARKSLEDGLDEEELALLLRWFGSSTGKTVTALEIKGTAPASMERMEAAKNKLMNTAQGPERIERIKTLYEATKTQKYTVNMALHMEAALSIALSGARNAADDKAFDPIRDQLFEKRPEVESMLAEKTWLTFLFTYRNLKRSEIDDYIAFARSSHGQKFNDLLSSAIADALTEAGRKAGRAINDYLENKSSG